MGALLLAKGLVGSWEKVGVIDTENGSADLYSHLGNFTVATLRAPFHPQQYVDAIHALEDAGVEVVVIDSITHEWAGKGGILELADEMGDDRGRGQSNKFTVWSKLTPLHNAFIDAILQSPIHMVCCGRSKQDYVMNQVEKNGRMVNVPEKVGLKSITREGFDYEMTVSFDIAINHYAATTKDRTKLFDGKPEFKISEETGKQLREWNEGAAEDFEFLRKQIWKQFARLGYEPQNKEEATEIVAEFSGKNPLPLVEKNFAKILETLKAAKSLNEAEGEEIARDNEELPEQQEGATPDPKADVKSEEVEEAQDKHELKPIKDTVASRAAKLKKSCK